MRLRIKDFASKVGSGVTPRGGAEVYQNSGIPLFRSQNITNEGLKLDDIAYISEDIHESMSGTHLRANDVLLNITGASIGRCYYLPSDFQEGNVNQHVCIIRPKGNVISAYLYYNLISERGQRKINFVQTGMNREGLTKEDISNFDFDIPSLPDQQHVVSYLDDKTAQIDTRISVLEQKRDAYEQLKKSIINDAVTKGLNPNVEMKESGVERIGQIPAHWECKRFKELASTTKGKQTDYLDEKVPDSDIVLTVETLRQDIPSFFNYVVMPDKRQHCTDDDLVVIWDGAGVGEFLRAKEGVLSSTIAKVTVDESKVLKEYLWLWRYKIEYTLKSIPTGMGIPHLNPNLLNSFMIPIPPLSEQQEIIDAVNEKSEKLDKATSNLEAQIEQYKLLKRSLINEVITGQRAV